MDKCLLVSYIPLMDYSSVALQAPLEIGSPAFEHLSKSMDAYQNMAYGCLWVTDNGEYTPVLVVDRAADLVAHMTAWAEQKPQEWFFACAAELDGVYAVAVIPNLEKGIDRWRTQYLMTHGEFAPQRDFKILFKPLIAIVKNGRFNYCREKLSNRVGFIDVNDAPHLWNDQSAVDHIIYLDGITYGPPDMIKPYVSSMLKDDDDSKHH